MKSRVVLCSAAVLFALGAAAGSAQTPPASPAPAPTSQAIQMPPLPSGTQILNDVINTVAGQATGAFGYNPNQAHGKVTFFKRFDMEVQLQLNKYRQVRLHQGTVINPRGTTIQPGQTVDVWGHQDANGTLEADRITVYP